METCISNLASVVFVLCRNGVICGALLLLLILVTNRTKLRRLCHTVDDPPLLPPGTQSFTPCAVPLSQLTPPFYHSTQHTNQ